jgi:hypothetical protein
MRILLAMLAGLVAGAVQAQEFVPRETDIRLDAAMLREAVFGHTHEFFDGGRSFFSISGDYSYTFGGDRGGTAFGQYTLGEDGVVCMVFLTGAERCDMYVRGGGRLVLITQDGDRFPVREVF